MNSVWQKLPKPFFVLAPMADVTDVAFRTIIAKYGKPDLMYTEFVSADGLVHDQAKERLKLDLRYGEIERPIVAQLFSSKPQKMFEAARVVRELGFDGLDVNMGCPDRGIEKQGAGASMIKNPALALEVIAAAEEGFGEQIAVKTRLGYSKLSEFRGWVAELIKAKPAAITMHLRTRAEMSKVPAHWELASEFAEMLSGTDILSLCNGDVKDLADAKQKAKEHNLNGVMIGRGIFHNFGLFAEKEFTHQEKLMILLEHTKLFQYYNTGHKSFAVMRRFFKIYTSGHPNAKEIQERLMACDNLIKVEEVLKGYML